MPVQLPAGPSTHLAEQLDAYAASVRANRPAGWRERLRGWAPYAAALGSGLALTTAADAGIIYSGVQDLTVTVDNGPGSHATAQMKGIAFTGTQPDFKLVLKFNRSAMASATTTGGQAMLKGVNSTDQMLPNASGRLRRLFSGSAVGTPLQAGSFMSGARALVSQYTRRPVMGLPASSRAGTWPKSATGFAGVEFTLGGQTHFGWIRLEWQDTKNTPQGYPNTLTAIDWAYNDVAGEPIRAGQEVVPEPSSLALALMAAGSVGVLAWRKRRAASLKATGQGSPEP